MRLRNWKETVEPTLEETLNDVSPRDLDHPFGWYCPPGSPVWVKTPEGKWIHGTVDMEDEDRKEFTDFFVQRYFWVYYGRGRNRKYGLFKPRGGNMKPDTPEVRELLRKAGYFV